MFYFQHKSIKPSGLDQALKMRAEFYIVKYLGSTGTLFFVFLQWFKRALYFCMFHFLFFNMDHDNVPNECLNKLNEKTLIQSSASAAMIKDTAELFLLTSCFTSIIL